MFSIYMYNILAANIIVWPAIVAAVGLRIYLQLLLIVIIY